MNPLAYWALSSVMKEKSFITLADILACLLDLSLVETACLSEVSMLMQGKLARLIFSKVKSLVH